jgi:hypothetical protein
VRQLSLGFAGMEQRLLGLEGQQAPQQPQVGPVAGPGAAEPMQADTRLVSKMLEQAARLPQWSGPSTAADAVTARQHVAEVERAMLLVGLGHPSFDANSRSTVPLLVGSLKGAAAKRFAMVQPLTALTTYGAARAAVLAAFARPEDQRVLHQRVKDLKLGSRAVREMATELQGLFEDLDGSLSEASAIEALLKALEPSDPTTVRLVRYQQHQLKLAGHSMSLHEAIQLACHMAETQPSGGPVAMDLGAVRAAEASTSQVSAVEDDSRGRWERLGPGKWGYKQQPAKGREGRDNSRSPQRFSRSPERDRRDGELLTDPRSDARWPWKVRRSMADLQRLKRQGRCYLCERVPGHVWSTCPEFFPQQQGKGFSPSRTRGG